MTVFAVAYVILNTFRLITYRQTLRIAEQQKEIASEAVASNSLLRESNNAFLARLGDNTTSSIEWSEETQERTAAHLSKSEDREARLSAVLDRAEALLEKLESRRS